MKSIIFILALSACSSIKANQDISIFNTSISINQKCEIVFNSQNKNEKYITPFKNSGDCRIVTHAHTNVVNVKFINGMYILFVENNIKNGEKCLSEYTAFGISKDNEIYVTDRVKKSGACFQDQEVQSFEYFAAKLKSLKE